MPAKTESAKVIKAKKKLGTLIAKCRGNDMSQRQLAAAVGLPPSNMKYIEDGINCPTAEVYTKLISVLKPSPKKQTELDRAYMTIRNIPPPDICRTIIANQTLIEAVRSLDGARLTDVQSQRVKELFASFASENTKGEQSNG